MSKTIPPIKGMRDLLPEQAGYWHRLEREIKSLFRTYGYQEIRTPILEYTDLFKRGVGEVTDIVEKEMYTFSDRNNESVTMRPENTASCVRAGLSNGLLHNQRHRFWYYGPMFRYENPQKGRYRQFYQFGAEAFGYAGPAVDVELLCLTAQLWQRLGIKNLSLEINSIGTPESRLRHREKLVTYFSNAKDQLDEDSLRRLETNPLRILDSKNPAMQELIEGAPRLMDHLDEESISHFETFQSMLSAVGIEFSVNPRLVRGLDYYTRTVFEWITSDLGAQSAVCAGGRYDGLVEQLGGKSMPAVGWSLGAERVVELMQLYEVTPEDSQADAFLIVVGDDIQTRGMGLTMDLRQSLPGLVLTGRGGEGGYKAQFKAALASGATQVLVLRDDTQDQQVGYKDLRDNEPEQQISVPELKQKLQSYLESKSRH